MYVDPEDESVSAHPMLGGVSALPRTGVALAGVATGYACAAFMLYVGQPLSGMVFLGATELLRRVVKRWRRERAARLNPPARSP